MPGLLPASRHLFRVTVFNEAGASLPSAPNTVTVPVLCDVPDAPYVSFLHTLAPSSVVRSGTGERGSWRLLLCQRRDSTSAPPSIPQSCAGLVYLLDSWWCLRSLIEGRLYVHAHALCQIIEWCITNVNGDPVRSFELQQRQLVQVPPSGRGPVVAGEEAVDGHMFTPWTDVRGSGTVA